MRIVIDLEAAQMPQTRGRGIGRYSMALAKAMLRQANGHEILVALNGAYRDATVDVRAQLDGLIEPDDIRTWHAALPEREPATDAERNAQRLVRESFFASLAADVVHVSSVFSFGPYSLPTVGGAHARHRTSVTLYDLIPLLNPALYLRDERAARTYRSQLAQLERADMWLAISESSRREGIDHLALPADRVFSIPPAADEQFNPSPVPAPSEVALRLQYGLWRPFAMYTGGIDPRKNVDGLIEAWAALPRELRRAHQLAIVCSVHDGDRARLTQLARERGLDPWDVIFTGFVPEEQLPHLYRMAKLFVFPSLHEGFGLPALEAMSCGTATIGADNSSIPEVIGRADAMFDGRSREAMAAKIAQCLADDRFRARLERHAIEQSGRFDWDRSAQRAIAAMEQFGPARPHAAAPKAGKRPRLAFVSPLPPLRTGIADYSAQLLPALSEHYEIDLVAEQPLIDEQVKGAAAAVRDPSWFLDHGHEYERIVYQFGNSDFHGFMLPLLRRHPGTVVLHDFFLSGLLAHREFVTEPGPLWTPALYESHGWPAFFARWQSGDVTPVIYQYPANFAVLRDAKGVIVHSPHAKLLAHEWYGATMGRDWKVIPLVRTPQARRREEARRELGLAHDDFLVCSFGIVGPPKMSDRLLSAWSSSALANDPKARLVFVGENDKEAYGRGIVEQIESGGLQATITGWADEQTFRRYLDAADVAVQLRTLSRGETSAAVLDAMNHGVAVIANANGSMAYLPQDAVWLLQDEFTDAELEQALHTLRVDASRRHAMGAAGRNAIETMHSPGACAGMYADAMEAYAAQGQLDARSVAQQVGELLSADAAPPLAEMAAAISHDLPEAAPARQLLFDVTTAGASELLLQLAKVGHPGWRVEAVYTDAQGQRRYARRFMQDRLDLAPQLDDDVLDLRRGDVWAITGDASTPAQAPTDIADAGIECLVLPSSANAEFAWACIAQRAHHMKAPRCFVDISELVRYDWKSGIQRVVKNDLAELLRRPPAGSIVVPVYTRDGDAGYRVARQYLYELAGMPQLLDGAPDPFIQPHAGDVFFGLDLQPHLIARNEAWLRQFREAGGRVAFMLYDLLPMQLPDCFVPGAAEQHERWLRVVAQSDLVIAISHAVATQFEEWLTTHTKSTHVPVVRHVHLGADIAIANGLASQGLPDDAQELLDRVRACPSFLMVGTLEPRKSHAAVLDAFDMLWARGSNCMLVIVGKPGWMFDELASRLRTHAEAGKRLVWLESASDEFLESLYGACSALILASRGEGFGLPLIEAAQRGLRLIARDLPVFREVAGDHAFYFEDDSAHALANAIAAWLELDAAGTAPNLQGMRWLGWRESAARVRREIEALFPL